MLLRLVNFIFYGDVGLLNVSSVNQNRGKYINDVSQRLFQFEKHTAWHPSLVLHVTSAVPCSLRHSCYQRGLNFSFCDVTYVETNDEQTFVKAQVLHFILAIQCAGKCFQLFSYCRHSPCIRVIPLRCLYSYKWFTTELTLHYLL